MTQLNKVGRVATSVYKEYGYTCIRYHSTEVVRFNERYILLNSNGWTTATTKLRMNQAAHQFDLGFYVYQTDYVWRVVLPDGSDVRFEDDLIIDRKTGALKVEWTADSIADACLMQYIGDVNLSYGGLYISLDDWRHHYANLTRITDLSDAGFDGAVMVEQGSLYFGKPESIRSALKCTGGIYGLETSDRKVSIISALVWYHGFDVERSIIIQTDEDGKMSFDGWKADIKLTSGETLVDWIGENLHWIEP